MTGCSPATATASRSSSNASGSCASGTAAGGSARLVGEVGPPDGRLAGPVFQLLAQRYLDPGYAPEAVAIARHPAATIRRLAAEMARTAFEEEIEARRSVDRLGGAASRDDAGPAGLAARNAQGSSATRTASRPAAPCICFRCCSARSTCRAAGGANSPHPKPAPPGPKPAGRPEQVAPGKPAPGKSRSATRCLPRTPDPRPRGAALSHRQGVLLGRADRRARHDAHGHPNAGKGDPSPIARSYVYDRHSLELGDEYRRDNADVRRQGPTTGDYRVPRIIYSDAYSSETVPTPIS